MSIEDFLPAYLGRQRWFSGDEPTQATVVQQEELAEGLRWMLVDADGDRYQVLLGLAAAETPPDFVHGHDDAVVGVVDDELVFDAVLDPDRARALMAKVAPGEEVEHVRPMGVEQSHTSLVFDDRLVLKIFRRLQDGPNPDIEVTNALADVGFEHVAPPLATWTFEESHLAAVQPYLAGGAQGSELALTSLRDLYDVICEDPGQCGGDFAGEARRLGEVTAEMHLALVRALGSEPGDPSAWASTAEAQLDRLGDDDADPVAAKELFGKLRSLDDAGASIRVHGDYHLGQVLRTDNGWFVLDFEGEPARPAGERQERSSPLKDVAGMLRSFHYATELALVEGAGYERDALAPLASAWEVYNRRAFLDGYLGTEGVGELLPPDEEGRTTVLSGFELDKAVYEVLYERDHRPDWIEIPRRAIRRLTHG